MSPTFAYHPMAFLRRASMPNYLYSPAMNDFDRFTAKPRAGRVLKTIQGQPLLAGWRPPALQLESGKDPLGDFPAVAAYFFPVFSHRAWTALAGLLADCAEALPVQTPEGQFFAINVLRAEDCLDPQRARFARLDNGTIYRVEQYAFLADAEPAPLFRVPQSRSDVLVTETFRTAVEAAGLVGLNWFPLDAGK
jgi:hypothetical protein